MPVYEYRCKACEREFEYQQRMSDPDKTVCEACGGELEPKEQRNCEQKRVGPSSPMLLLYHVANCSCAQPFPGLLREGARPNRLSGGYM